MESINCTGWPFACLLACAAPAVGDPFASAYKIRLLTHFHNLDLGIIGRCGSHFGHRLPNLEIEPPIEDVSSSQQICSSMPMSSEKSFSVHVELCLRLLSTRSCPVSHLTVPNAAAETQEEQPDPQQNAMLKDIHLQQAAGITEMIQGVKDNLMQMQTLKNRGDGGDAGLEIFNKIGGGGFGEVFKGKYKGVRLPFRLVLCL